MVAILSEIGSGYRELDLDELTQVYGCKARIEKNEWHKVLVLSFGRCIVDELGLGTVNIKDREFLVVSGRYGPDSRTEALCIPDESAYPKGPILIYTTEKRRWPRRDRTVIKVNMTYLKDERVTSTVDFLARLAAGLTEEVD